MKNLIYVLLCFSLLLVSCDEDVEFSPSPAELIIQRLQEEQVQRVAVISESMSMESNGNLTFVSYQIENPFIVVSYNSLTYKLNLYNLIGYRTWGDGNAVLTFN